MRACNRSRKSAQPILLAIVFAALTPIARPDLARACDCDPGPTVNLFDRADAVFTAILVAIEPDSSYPFPDPIPDRRLNFRVLQVWKGDIATDVGAITNGGGDGTCGLSGPIARELLVFAFDDAGQLRTSDCLAFNVKYANTSDRLMELNAIAAPETPGSGPDPNFPPFAILPCGFGVLGATLFTASTLAVLALVRRRSPAFS